MCRQTMVFLITSGKGFGNIVWIEFGNFTKVDFGFERATNFNVQESFEEHFFLDEIPFLEKHLGPFDLHLALLAALSQVVVAPEFTLDLLHNELGIGVLQSLRISQKTTIKDK